MKRKPLTTAEAAARLGVPLTTIQRWVQCGWLPHWRIPPGVDPRRQTVLIEVADLDAFERPMRGRPKKEGTA